MAAYNRRADGQRPPHRGRSDRESNPVWGEIRNEAVVPLEQQRLSPRETRNRRQRGRAFLPLERQDQS